MGSMCKSPPTQSTDPEMGRSHLVQANTPRNQIVSSSFWNLLVPSTGAVYAAREHPPLRQHGAGRPGFYRCSAFQRIAIVIRLRPLGWS